MELEENEFGGETVILSPGDDLKKVPKSHRSLVTPQIRRIFADPSAWLWKTSETCHFRPMRRWLESLLVKNDWTLELNKSDEDLDLGLADFYWRSEDVMPAMIVPPQEYDLSEYHPTLQKFYALVDHVHWCPWGNGGGFWDATSHVTPYEADHHGDSITLDETVQWGADLDGNQMIYTTDGRAGWIKLTSAQVRLLGSIEDTINWVFGELLARREPRWNEEWSAERR